MGASMYPTLKAGDSLKIMPFDHNEVRVGDVIIFLRPNNEFYIAHRIVSVNASGVRTRGDNNHKIDPWVLHSEEIIGKVVSAQRGKKKLRKIYGGLHGKIFSIAFRLEVQAKIMIYKALSPAYPFLTRSITFRGLITHWMKIKVVYFKRPEGMEMQLLLGQKVIGKRLPWQERWHIRYPFKLLVDENSLPLSKPL